MDNFGEKLLAVLLTAVLIVSVANAFRRESAQANLKAGIWLNARNEPAAIEVLKNGIRKNRGYYYLYVTLAESLQKKASFLIANGGNAKMTLLQARHNLQKALALRFDSFDHLLLGDNYKMEGAPYTALAYNYELEGASYAALAHYNISFFFSQDVKELERWGALRKNQAKAAAEYFRFNSVPIALLMIYNHLVDFKVRPPDSPAEVFISSFFLSIQPDEWLSSNPKEDRLRLKENFSKLAPAQKDELERAFRSAGFGFLARFLAV